MTYAEFDLESRLSHSDHEAVKLWLRLLTTTTLMEGVIRSRLQAHGEISMPRFDLLSQLEREPGGLRMTELSARLMVTKGNVTGLADQLERDGLVERISGPDRRSTLLRLTPKGRDAFNAIANTHEGWVVELLSGLSKPEQQQLYALLAKLKGQVRVTAQSEPAGE